MKAMIYKKYGNPDVLEKVEVEKPSIAKDEILIKVCATSVTSGDARMRRGTRHSLPLWPLSKLAIGMFKPRRHLLGFEFSGVVEAIGSEVTKYKVGDEVFGLHSKGTYTEYICKKQQGIMAIKPSILTHDEAASVLFGASTALFFLSKSPLNDTKEVLIYGASGAVGVMAVQLAKYYGAKVTAVCSYRNTALMQSLEADQVVDYTKEDISDLKTEYDVVFDTVGKTKYRDLKPVLKKDAYYLQTVFGYRKLMEMLWMKMISSRKNICTVSVETLEGLAFLRERFEQGHMVPVLDKVYEFDALQEAHAYVETGHKKGSVSIRIHDDISE